MRSWPDRAPQFAPKMAVVALLLLSITMAGNQSKAQTASTGDDSEAAFRRVSNRLLCQCGCNYMVLSCNHLDCPSATYIRKTIKTSLAAGQSEDTIVASFVEQYGMHILPEPPREGFSLMAWVMPFLALVLGGGAVSYVLWQWKWKPQASQTGDTPDNSQQAISPTDQDLQPPLVEKYRAQIDRELEQE